MASASLQPPSRLQRRGNTYSQLTTKQQSDTAAQLPLLCHSLETLQRSGVLLDVDPLSSDIIAKKQGLNITDFVPTPDPKPAIEKRKAISIACQAAETAAGGIEPVSICVIDFFTGQTLLDSFIAPSCEISDWKTERHGVSARTIETAVKGNNCLRSWREARRRVFEYVDAQTIFVGFSIGRDLGMLRVFHRGVVDARVLAMEALFTVGERADGGLKDEVNWGIDRVCMGLVGLEMRAGGGMEKRVCDGYEDVLVVREIVLRFLQKPGDVEGWVRRERLEMFGDAVRGEGENVVGKSAKRAGRRSKKTGGKESSSAKTETHQKAKRIGNRKREQADKDPVVQSLKELSIGTARQKPRQDEEPVAVLAAVRDANHGENISKTKPKSGNGRASRKTRKEKKKKMEAEAQEKAKTEASLKAMVREEERSVLTFGKGKQGARTAWETKNRAERRAKWVESQRDESN